jgi:hypothetical protein
MIKASFPRELGALPQRTDPRYVQTGKGGMDGK